MGAFQKAINTIFTTGATVSRSPKIKEALGLDEKINSENLDLMQREKALNKAQQKINAIYESKIGKEERMALIKAVLEEDKK